MNHISNSIMHFLKKVMITVGVAVVGYVLLALLAAHNFTRPIKRNIENHPNGFLTEVEEVRFATADGLQIAGWFVRGASQDQAIILLHGYRTDRREVQQRALWLHQMGYSALMYDARGHGESTGDRVSIGYYERYDLEAAISFLQKRGYSQLACLGISQGAATIILAANALDSMKCVILESPYTTAADAIDRRFRNYLKFPGWPAGSGILAWSEVLLSVDADSISPLRIVNRLKPPKLFLSGMADRRTWPSDVQHLYDASAGEKRIRLIPKAGHQDLMQFDQYGYEQIVGAFLQKHFPIDQLP